MKRVSVVVDGVTFVGSRRDREFLVIHEPTPNGLILHLAGDDELLAADWDDGRSAPDVDPCQVAAELARALNRA